MVAFPIRSDHVGAMSGLDQLSISKNTDDIGHADANHDKSGIENDGCFLNFAHPQVNCAGRFGEWIRG